MRSELEESTEQSVVKLYLNLSWTYSLFRFNYE